MGLFGIEIRPGKKPIYDIENAIEEIKQYISEIYGIEHFHPASFMLFDTPERREYVLELLRKRHNLSREPMNNWSREEGENLMDSALGLCIFTRDFIEDSHYFVGIKDKILLLPNIIGEEISHGEHYCLHSLTDSGTISYDAYREKFHGISSELIGSLIHYNIYEQIKDFDFIGKKSNSNHGLRTKADIANHISMNLAAASILYQIDIPHKDIFHAKDEEHLWDIWFESTNLDFIVPIEYDPLDKSGKTLDELKNDIREVIHESKTRTVVVEMNIQDHGIELVGCD